MKLLLCSICQCHIVTKECPDCIEAKSPSKTSSRRLALLLGSGLAACGDKEDTAQTDTATEEHVPEPDMAALYGVEEN